jgi:hypothetical protein
MSVLLLKKKRDGKLILLVFKTYVIVRPGGLLVAS